jgi:hypothetical protein
MWTSCTLKEGNSHLTLLPRKMVALSTVSPNLQQLSIVDSELSALLSCILSDGPSPMAEPTRSNPLPSQQGVAYSYHQQPATKRTACCPRIPPFRARIHQSCVQAGGAASQRIGERGDSASAGRELLVFMACNPRLDCASPHPKIEATQHCARCESASIQPKSINVQCAPHQHREHDQIDQNNLFNAYPSYTHPREPLRSALCVPRPSGAWLGFVAALLARRLKQKHAGALPRKPRPPVHSSPLKAQVKSGRPATRLHQSARSLAVTRRGDDFPAWAAYTRQAGRQAWQWASAVAAAAPPPTA